MKKLGWLVAGFGLGALAAYVFDPVSGSRRRETVRKNADRLRGQVNSGIEVLNNGVETISSLIGDAPDAKSSGDTHSVH